MEDDVVEEKSSAKPYLTRLRLALAPYTVHFQNPGYIKDETMRMLERDVVKRTLEGTRRNFELRYAPSSEGIADGDANDSVRNSASPKSFGTTSLAS